MGKIRGMFMIGRPWFYSFGMAGVFFSSIMMGNFPPILALIAAVLVFGPLIPGGCTALNDCYDVEIDMLTKPQSPITRGDMSRNFAIRFSYVCYILGLGIALMVNWLFFLCALGFAVLSYTYSVPPLRLKGKHIFGTAAKGFGYGFFATIAGASLTASNPLSLEFIAIGLLMSLVVAATSLTTEFRDVSADKKHGVRTIVSMMTRKKAAWVTSSFLLLPYVLFYVLITSGVISATFFPVTYMVIYALLMSFLLIRDPSPEGSMKVVGLSAMLISITFAVLGISGFFL